MDVLGWLSRSGIAEAMIAQPDLYILTNAAHILGIALLVGAILPLDLRLAGVLRRADLSVLVPFLTRAAMTGLVLALLTGLVLFAVNPVEYAANPALQVKLGLICLGLVNAALLHLTYGRRFLAAPSGAAPVAVRAAAALSILIWLAALLAGRWIGFV